MRCLLRWSTLAVTLLAGAAAPAGEIKPLLAADELAQWEFVTPEGVRALAEVGHVESDGSFALAGQPTGFVATKAAYANYTLRLEWRWTDRPGNGGVLLHIASGPKDRAWPVSFQVQTKRGAVGDLLPMAGASFAEPLTSAPGATPVKARLAADCERAVGEWNSCEITCRDGTIAVRVNGVEQNRVSGCSVRAGRIGLQFEGAPFAVRAVTIEPL